MTDAPDPADVIAGLEVSRTPDPDGDWIESVGHIRAPKMLTQIKAAGFRVVPEVDDDTRAEVERLIERIRNRKVAYEVARRYGIAVDLDHIDMIRFERMADLLSQFVLREVTE